jgi:hypothetical protein
MTERCHLMANHRMNRRSAAAVGISCLALGALAAVGFTALGGTGANSADPNVLVQSTGAYAYQANGSIAKHYDQPVQAGDLLTASVNWDAAGSPDGVSAADGLGNVWTLDSSVHGDAADRALAVFHTVAQVGGDDTVTVSFGAARTQRYININEYAAGTSAPPSSSAVPTTEPPSTTPPVTTTAPPTVTPTPTPTPTPSPTQTVPPSTGFPDASNTGYKPTGVTLHSCTASFISGGTYDSCTFPGGISVSVPNVTITRSLINGQVKSNSTGLVISDTEINCHCGSSSNTTPPIVSFSGFTLLRDNIYNGGHGVQIDDSAVVRDSWIHDLCCSGNQAHADGIISNGNDGSVVIDHNTVDGAGAYMSAAIGLFGDFASIKNWQITNNLLNTTGSYCLYGGAGPAAKKYPNASNVVASGNRFGKKYNAKCGIYGPVADFGGSGSSWSGNVWADTGATVIP